MLFVSAPQSSKTLRRRPPPHPPVPFALHYFLLIVIMSLGCLSKDVAAAGRKLPGGGSGRVAVLDRDGPDCSSEDLLVYQAAMPPLPTGIPTYTVHVMNVCVNGCTIADIHMSCGWFSSAQLVNPRVFRRLGYDDCLVNDGGGLEAGGSISFQYANTFKYPMSVTSMSCNAD